MLICKFCAKECKNLNSHSNHQRLCPQNKDRNYVSHTLGSAGHIVWNKGITGDPRCSRKGINKGNTVSKEHKAKLSILAKERGLGGYQPNAGISKKFKVIDSFGNEVCLQSTYELLCSKILNELNIQWLRPKALKYDSKRYFADFYLPHYDLYLDPKNSYKAKLDKDKIEKVKAQNNVQVVILLEHELTIDFIKSLCKFKT